MKRSTLMIIAVALLGLSVINMLTINDGTTTLQNIETIMMGAIGAGLGFKVYGEVINE